MSNNLHLTHLLSRVFDTPLLIEPHKLEVIMGVLKPKILNGTLSADSGDQERVDRRPYRVEGGVAIIPVYGTLVQRASGLDAMSGMVSYNRLGDMVNTAVRDDGVQAILLDVDSPGGEVAGCFDLCDKIYSARNKKPIWAVANEVAASAAYAIASSASRIIVARTGMVGSIGVVALHLDQSGFDAQLGLNYTYIFAGSHKIDGNPHEPLSDDARTAWQAAVDDAYSVFVKAVSRNRKMSVDAVRATQANVFTAPDAVNIGLADEVGTLEGAIVALRKQLAPQGGRNAANSRKENRMANRNGRMSPEDELAEYRAAMAGLSAGDREKILGGTWLLDDGPQLMSVETIDVPSVLRSSDDSPRVIQMQSRLAEIQSEQQERERRYQLREAQGCLREATADVDHAIEAGTILSAGRAAAIVALAQAYADDGGIQATFMQGAMTDESIKIRAHPTGVAFKMERTSGNRAAAVMGLFAQIQPQEHLGEKLKSVKPMRSEVDAPADADASKEERRRRNLSRTPLGQSALTVVKKGDR
jgi:signal peptide peptidase SppA